MNLSIGDLLPKRRWFQFSLKTLLIGMTVLCIGPGGYVAYEQAKARRQKAAVEAIEDLGGWVEYDQDAHVRSATMRQILGDESFGNASSVWLHRTQVTNAGLVPIASIIGLRYLSLHNTQVTNAGLVQLASLTRLEGLYLNDTQVTDVGLVHLAGLTKLKFLDLHNTPVTDAGAAKLQKALPNCHILR